MLARQKAPETTACCVGPVQRGTNSVHRTMMQGPCALGRVTHKQTDYLGAGGAFRRETQEVLRGELGTKPRK